MVDATPAKIQKERIISPIWLLPILAIVLGLWLIYKAWSEAGIRIEIEFESAQGIIAGQTQIFYQGLDVGVVKNVRLDESLKGVIIEAEISPKAEQLLREDTQFWLVTPKASLTEISGLDALVTGNYIALLPGEGKAEDRFVALREAPLRTKTEGLLVKLIADKLGSLKEESPVYFKQIRVGEVGRYALTDDHRVEIDVLIEPEFAELVKSDSHFWNVSGVRSEISLDGFKFESESLISIINGGLAFDSPQNSDEVESGHTFSLYPNINAAQRGHLISITAAELGGLKAGSSKILHKGLPVAYVISHELKQAEAVFEIQARVEPQFSYMFNSSTVLLPINAEIGLGGVKNAAALLGATNLELHFSEGETRSQFSLATTISNQAATITLTSPQVEGLSTQSVIKFRGLEIGKVQAIDWTGKQFEVAVSIEPNYLDLVNANSRFHINPPLKLSANLDGVEIESSGLAGFLNTPIELLSSTATKSGPAKQVYSLYPTAQAAMLASNKPNRGKTLKLIAKELGSISIGAPVLYKQLQVGAVSNYRLVEDKHIQVELSVDGKYAHLLNQHARFWHASGLEVKASLAGVSVETESLKALVAGGIAFDHFEQLPHEKTPRLYTNKTAALQRKLPIRLVSNDANGVYPGMPIQFQSQKIGEVVSVGFSKGYKQAELQAELYYPYSKDFARDGANYWQQGAEISLNKVDHLDTLVKGEFIAASPGLGQPNTQFHLTKTQPANRDVLTVYVEAPALGSLRAQSPVLYKQVKVGEVVATSLLDSGEGVSAKLEISSDYQHLVRENSVFWNASGVDMKLGLTGADIRLDSVESLLAGGIGFATPDDQDLAAPAKDQATFKLNANFEQNWLQWAPIIPKP